MLACVISRKTRHHCQIKAERARRDSALHSEVGKMCCEWLERAWDRNIYINFSEKGGRGGAQEACGFLRRFYLNNRDNLLEEGRDAGLSYIALWPATLHGNK